jgi:hypothetical protein
MYVIRGKMFENLLIFFTIYTCVERKAKKMFAA